MLFFIFSVYATAIQCNETLPSEMVCLDNDIHPCILDQTSTFLCYVFPSTNCEGERSFNLSFPCRYCYQLPSESIYCNPPKFCKFQMKDSLSSCFATERCVGNSSFYRREKCRHTTKSQKTAVFLSLFLGAVGADRFYLGHYTTAAFKLITVGGFGIAYTIDLLLIIAGYLGPKDGSGYIERL
ncbi:TM2 domain-containing protein 3 [Tritrichomonas foetus]|uniref:TM2 domain-containing protein 3 n=1 Tax=Tritrichomonas foetus TaxID=1144522 RepID=A0A1J4JHI4_9EUKA|nr:TM2 domain-containing protein 3 [Tritrichomonas foetus]|eukprot:OHS97067.1 TM2 domain-containing protein 3 [Tritrichomonas foetus]